MKTTTDITQATAGAIGRLALMLFTALAITLAAPVMSAQTATAPEPVAPTDTLYSPLSPYSPQDPEKYPAFALRTNLLLPALNVGAELPLGNRWSIGADYYYPWVWPKSSNKNCFELIFVSAEARYWLGSKHTSNPDNRQHRLIGHSVGVYGAWGYYDFEHNYRGHQGHFRSAGIDYLFAMPIAKGRLHLEFEIAIGGIWSRSHPYNVFEEGGELITDRNKMKRFDFVGPTKVGVSLVIPINRTVKSPAPK